jgi:hypothetical protein
MAVASRLSELTFDRTRELEQSHAKRDALHDALRRLVAYVKRTNEYMSAEDQQTLREAEAALEEDG